MSDARGRRHRHSGRLRPTRTIFPGRLKPTGMSVNGQLLWHAMRGLSNRPRSVPTLLSSCHPGPYHSAYGRYLTAAGLRRVWRPAGNSCNRTAKPAVRVALAGLLRVQRPTGNRGSRAATLKPAVRAARAGLLRVRRSAFASRSRATSIFRACGVELGGRSGDRRSCRAGNLVLLGRHPGGATLASLSCLTGMHRANVQLDVF